MSVTVYLKHCIVTL